MAAVFSTTAAKPKPVTTEPTQTEPDYDNLVPKRLKEASDAKLRALIVWADYCYWVKNEPIMRDTTFDLLVREYEARQPEDRTFLDKIGMWSTR